jgi:hypothetical protein
LAVNVNWFGQTEDEPTALFEPNNRGGSHAGWDVTWRSLDVSALTPDEKAGGLNREVQSSNMNRLESEADVTVIGLQIGSPDGFHASRDCRAQRQQIVSCDHHGLIDGCLEGGVRIRTLGKNGILQTNGKQCASGQILGILEWKSRFWLQSIGASLYRFVPPGHFSFDFMKRNLSRLSLSSF